MLAVTGIGLNHSDQLALDQQFVDARWLYRFYGEKPTELSAYRAGERWLYRNSEGIVYVDTAVLGPCRGELVGGQAYDGLLYVACEEELLLATPGGELVEAITIALGLPGHLSAVGLADGQLTLQTGNGWRLADIDRLAFDSPLPEGAIIQTSAAGILPERLQAQIPMRDQWLSWERVLLDLHSGRLGGRAGVLLVDLAGIIISLLGISGVIMWWLHHRAGRRRR